MGNAGLSSRRHAIHDDRHSFGLCKTHAQSKNLDRAQKHRVTSAAVFLKLHAAFLCRSSCAESGFEENQLTLTLCISSDCAAQAYLQHSLRTMGSSKLDRQIFCRHSDAFHGTLQS